jgi:hypothetical protein
MTDTTQALQRKADKSRRRLTGLVQDLQRQISPGAMLDQVLGFSTDGASELGRFITTTVSKHPLPYLLIAVGTAWLMVSEASERSKKGTRKPVRRRKASSRRK